MDDDTLYASEKFHWSGETKSEWQDSKQFLATLRPSADFILRKNLNRNLIIYCMERPLICDILQNSQASYLYYP